MSPIRPDIAAVIVDQQTTTEALAGRVYFHTAEWHALMDWMRFHHIDPERVLAGTEVIRDARTRSIQYVAIVVDEHGRKQLDGPDLATARVLTRPAVEQGEAAPLPYPDVIAGLLEPVRRPA